jgi:hypothetical protein
MKMMMMKLKHTKPRLVWLSVTTISVLATSGFTPSSPQDVSNARVAIASDLDFDHINLDPEDGGSMFHRKICIHLQHDTARHSTTQHDNPMYTITTFKSLRFEVFTGWLWRVLSPCSLVEVCSLVYTVYSSTLKMEAVLSFETSLNFYQNIWRHNPGDSIVLVYDESDVVERMSSLHYSQSVYCVGIRPVSYFAASLMATWKDELRSFRTASCSWGKTDNRPM